MSGNVWDEDWFVYDNEPGRWVNVHAKGIGHIGMLNGETDERAQLAAAAPELARFADKLLKWAKEEDYGGNVDRHVTWLEMIAEAEAALVRAGVRKETAG